MTNRPRGMKALSVRTAALLLPLSLVLSFAVAEPAAAVPSRVGQDAAADATPTPTPTPTPSVAPDPAPSPSPELTPTPQATAAPEASPPPEPLPVPDTPEARLAPEATLAARVPTASRIAGADRFGLAVAASQAVFPDGAEAVVIASGYSTVDAVLAASLASTMSAPVLYVRTTGVPDNVLSELRRLAPGSIRVVDTERTVSDAVLQSLTAVTADVQRFGGANRYEASRQVLASAGAQRETVYLSGGDGLADAPLAMVAAAANDRGALIVDGRASAADAATIAVLRAVGATNLVILGGFSTMSAGYEQSLRAAGFVVARRGAADTYALSAVMAADRTSAVARALVVNPGAPQDAAVAAALAAATDQPLYYAIEQCVPDTVSQAIAQTGAAITAVGGTASIGPAVLTNTSCSAERATRQSRLNSAIQSAMSGYAGSYWVTVQEVGGLQQAVRIGGSTPREPASMMKLFAAWAALKKIDQGRASLATVLPSGRNLATCIHVMIHVSDNYCHSDIVHWIGIAAINRMIAGAGFLNTKYGTVAPGVSVLYAGNRTTTNDLAKLTQKLVDGSVLSRKYADHLLREMKSQIWRSRIASGIPPGVVQASKPGALWLASGLTQSDTAVVYGPRSTYIISVIVYGSPPQAALRSLSRTVYQHFHGVFGTAASYPVQQLVTTVATNVRSSPGGAVVAVAARGTLIEVIDAVRDWYLVRWGTRQLYIHCSALRNR